MWLDFVVRIIMVVGLIVLKKSTTRRPMESPVFHFEKPEKVEKLVVMKMSGIVSATVTAYFMLIF